MDVTRDPSIYSHSLYHLGYTRMLTAAFLISSDWVLVEGYRKNGDRRVGKSQCGNQLGYSLYDTLINEYDTIGDYPKQRYFRAAPDATAIARSVLVDMEPKVIQKCVQAAQSSNKWKYDEKQSYSRQSGSGNNWAFGYNVHGRETCDDVAEVVRKEVEHCDFFGGFLALQSVAGGTGSGLGTYITESLRDLYPSSYLLNTIVWPHSSGEVIVQNYNTLMTMARLTEVSDGIIVFKNDSVSEICKRLLKMKRPSLEAMNSVIARHLAMVLLPSSIKSGPKESSELHLLADFVNHMCLHPGYKLLDIKMIPQMPHTSRAFSSHQWAGLKKHLYQMHIADCALEEGVNWKVSLDSTGSSVNRAIASILFTRGARIDAVDFSEFADSRLYPSWNPRPFLHAHNISTFNKYDKSAAILSNSQSIVEPLRRVSSRAYEMYQSGAYRHQYEVHGVESEFFENSFIRVDQVVKNYEALSPASP